MKTIKQPSKVTRWNLSIQTQRIYLLLLGFLMACGSTVESNLGDPSLGQNQSEETSQLLEKPLEEESLLKGTATPGLYMAIFGSLLSSNFELGSKRQSTSYCEEQFGCNSNFGPTTVHVTESGAIFMASFYGFHLSLDSGKTFKNKGSLPAYYPKSIKVYGNRIFVMDRGVGIHISDDQGETFVAPKPFDQTQVASHGMVKVGNNFLLATEKGLYISIDQGDSFQPTSNLGEKQLTGIYTSGSELFVYEGGKTGLVYRSMDQGKTFASLNSPKIGYDAIDKIGDTLYLGTVDKGVYAFSNGSAIQVAGIPLDAQVMSIAHKDQHVYIGTWNKGLFHSVDGGKTFLSNPNIAAREIIVFK